MDEQAAETGEFFDAWAEAREALAHGDGERARQLAEQLASSAANVHQRTLVAAVEIEVGALLHIPQTRAAGINRLMGADTGDVLGVIDAISDTALIGSIDRRRMALTSTVLALAGNDDAGIRFVENPTLDAARTIARGGWSPPVPLGVKLQRELRRWIGWAAVDAWLEWRQPEYRDVLHSRSIAFDSDEPGGWEYELAVFVERMSLGDVVSAQARLRALQRRSVPGSWLDRALVTAVTNYAPLAGDQIDELVAVSPSGLLAVEDASTPLERAGSEFQRLNSPQCPGRVAKFQRIEEDVINVPWIAFCYFCTIPSDAIRQRLGEALLNSVRHEDDVKRWPWPSREQAFADACRALDRRETALALLDVSLRAMPSPVLAAACADVLEAASSDDLLQIVASDLGSRLGEHVDRLSPGRRKMLQRNGVWRVVIDGSNLCFGGKSRDAGAKANIDYARQAILGLASAGFSQIISYFDKGMRGRLGDEAWNKIQSMQVAGEVVVTNTNADRFIIEEFLRAPHATWVVTNDRFAEYLVEYPRLRAFWPRNQLRFHVGADDIVRWERPLDRVK